jgi:hypothetical protein
MEKCNLEQIYFLTISVILKPSSIAQLISRINVVG